MKNQMQGVPAMMFAKGKSTKPKATVHSNITQGTSSRPHTLQGKVGTPQMPISVKKPASKGTVDPMAILAAMRGQ